MINEKLDGNAYINHNCPICGGGKHYHKINNYTIDRCSSCGFVYVKNIPSDSKLFEYYDRSYKEGGIFRPNKSISRKIKYLVLSKFIQVVSGANKIKLLEIGCSQGYLLNAVKHNIRFDAEGIDYAGVPVKYAHSTGLKVFQSSLENMQYPSEIFDLIVALHVIEHVQDLKQTIHEIRRVLKKGGHLYIVVPCVSHVKAKVAGKKWKYFGPPGHLWYFTTKSAKMFLEKEGFSIKIATCLSHRAHLRVLAVKK